MRRPVLMLSLAAALAWASAAAANGIVVDLNGSVRVPLRGQAANVVIANPSVVDVAMIDSHSVVVIGKGFGETQILVTDHAGRTLMDSRVAVVGAEGSRVTLIHGGGQVEYDCTNRCQSLTAQPKRRKPARQRHRRRAGDRAAGECGAAGAADGAALAAIGRKSALRFKRPLVTLR